LQRPFINIGGHRGGHRRKNLKILENRQKRKNRQNRWYTTILAAFLGGDNRDRTGDLLNAIQAKSVGIAHFFGCLVVTWWS
jgi:hypothetical protein